MNKKRLPITLTHKELDLLSLICHDYKDTHRGSAYAILPVMALEKKIHKQNPYYVSDTTYDIK